MSDSKYFTTTKKGEIRELKKELDSPKENVKKDAVKKVIAAMTVGKDVSELFPDVVKCIRTQNLELKKLVYLYIMNYAKTQPETAILSVNAFVHDAQHPNPLVRALAVRTMGCIRVDKITEYLCQPLRECLRDKDPYVRKTAAVCVAKVWDINPELVETQGFLDMLRELLADPNPMVVANAVAALSEIDETSKEEVFRINNDNLRILLAAVNDCTEWGQVFILHALSKYTPNDSREAESIAERVAPRLAHANSAVVLSTIRVLMNLLEFSNNSDFVKTMCKKMAPPLVTLLQKEPEIQYVALRNINLIIQKRPQVLQGEMKVFFCKYNDPIYVKMEKLEIMIMLVSERTIEQVLLELKEYATEVDVEFVRKAVRAIGRCAIKLDRAADKCIKVLLELIQNKVNYVVQEAIIVIKDIFRKYPNQYESIIATLCENLDTLDDPEAKASMIWIIGEYAERIENADELLETFLNNFQDENSAVQLQLLTATVKLFLKKPKTTQKLVQFALDLATKESGNPDLRDRGFIYWRLLFTNAEAAKQVVLGEKPLISEDSRPLEASLLNELIGHMSTLASVYHKPPHAFVSKLKKKVRVFDPSKTDAKAARRLDKQQRRAAQTDASASVPASSSGPDEDQDSDSSADEAPSPSPSRPTTSSLIELETPPNPYAPTPTPATSTTGPIPGPVDNPLAFILQGPAVPKVGKQIWLTAEKGKGLEVRGGFRRPTPPSPLPVLCLTLTNYSPSPMTGFMIQFNKNFYRLKPASTVINVQQLGGGQSAEVEVPLTAEGDIGPVSPTIQIAIKNNVDVFYFVGECPLYTFFSGDGALEKMTYLQTWKSIPDHHEHPIQISPLRTSDSNVIVNTLQSNNIFLIAKRRVNDNDVLYLSTKVVLPAGTEAVILAEVTVQGNNSCKCCTRTAALDLVPVFEAAVTSLLL
jgi:vesicle coat complex subunit